MSENKSPEEETPASGSRWEKPDTPSEDGEVYQTAAAPEGSPVAGLTPTPAAPGRSAWLRGRSMLVGAGLGIALAAGAGGFALAHAVDGDRDGGRDGWAEFHGERWEHGDSERGMPMRPGPPGMPGMGGERPDFGQRMGPDDLDDSGSSSSDSDDATG